MGEVVFEFITRVQVLALEQQSDRDMQETTRLSSKRVCNGYLGLAVSGLLSPRYSEASC